MKRILMSAALSALLAAPAFAADVPADARTLATQLIDAAHLRNALDGIASAQMNGVMREIIARQGPDCQKNKACVDKVNKTAKKVHDVLKTYIESKETRALFDKTLVDFYTSKFTVDELRTIVTFYQSPAGQKVQQLAPQSLQGLEPALGADIGKRLTPQLKKLVEAK